MKLVQPIRDTKVICKIKEILKGRDKFLFTFGINSGLRISDILPLTVGDVRGKTHLEIEEQKTEKKKKFKINESLKRDIDLYTAGMGDTEYLFPSRQGGRPITRVQAYRVLNDAAKRVGLEEIGTHTLRKTFGFHLYQKTKDVAMLQEIFNHSAPSVTLRYIGINQDIIDECIDGFYL